MWSRWRALLSALFRRSSIERQLADELECHIDMRIADLVASGAARDEAARQAQREFGAVAAHKDACRDAYGLRMIDDLRADLRYAVRTLIRTPGLAIISIVSLALGIGANTVAFSVVNALVLQPLPVREPERLVAVQSGAQAISHSFPAYLDLRDRTTAFDALIGYRITPIDLDTGDAVERTWGYLATGNYFDALGVTPAVGRVFHQNDDLHEGQAPFAVLSYGCWTSRFGADPGVVGRTVRLNRTPFTIIGVAPKGFRGTELFYAADLWVPMMMEPQIEVGNPWLHNRMTGNTWIIGRLKHGVSASAAASDLNVIGAQLAREHPREDGSARYTVAKPGLVGSVLGAPVRDFALGVLALAGLVLVVACANLASVLAARSADRQRELAIRISIGAGRGRIVRQLLAETLLLSAIGGAAGCAVAAVAARALSAWHAPVGFPIQFDVSIDGRVLAFASAASLIAGVLFGIAPARLAARTNAQDALKDAASFTKLPWRVPVRDALLAVQVTVLVVLLSASLLAVRGLQRALTMSLGMEPRGVAMVGFDLGLAGYTSARGEELQRRAAERAAAIPGVTSAAYSNSLPLSIDYSESIVLPDDRPETASADVPRAVRYRVSPGFFATLGIKRELGRDITWRDTAASPRVAVVNRTFARTVMRTPNPLGRHFAYGWRADPIEIVGVVEDGKYWSLTETPQAAVFEPALQAFNGTTTLLVRSDRPPEQLLGELRRIVNALDPHLPLYQVGTVEQMLGFALLPSRAAAIALGAFGLLAVMLAGTGIYGLVAYSVSRRRREIAIRMAVGATRGGVLRLVLRRIAMVVALGVVVGLALAAAAGQLLSSIVYDASPRDPVVLAAVALAVTTIGVVSCWAPARQALDVPPATALRAE